MLYRFEEFEFDSDAMELKRAGERVDVRPSVLELLELLILNADRVVTKDELVDQLWGGRAVSDDAIAKRLSQLRKGLGDDGREARLIRSIYGKGMRFLGTVETPECTARSTAVRGALRVPGKPTSVPDYTRSRIDQTEVPALAILPFHRTGSDAVLPTLAQGIPDDVTNALVKLINLRVIARASAFRYSSVDTPIADLRRDLGVRYVLTGSVDYTGDGPIAIYIELCRTTDEALIWSEQYRVSPAEVHQMRDHLVAQIVNRIESTTGREEAARASLVVPESLTAWEAFHLGQKTGIETFTPDPTAAMAFFQRSIDLAPEFARARGWLAYLHWASFASRAKNSSHHRTEMLRLTDEAVSLDPVDPLPKLSNGLVHATLGSLDYGYNAIKSALDIAPSHARANACMAFVLVAKGDAEGSLRHIDTAIDMSPFDPHMPRWLYIRLAACLIKGDVDAAHRAASQIVHTRTENLSAVSWALVGFASAGDRSAAAVTADRLRNLLQGGRLEGVLGFLGTAKLSIHESFERTMRDYALWK